METKSQQLATEYSRKYITLTEQQIAYEAFLAGIQAKAEVRPTKKSIEERMNLFRSEVLLYSGKYQDDMLEEFFNYWTEHGANDRKMRFEKQTSWETSKRLARWANNNNKYGNRNYQSRRHDNSQTPSVFDIADKLRQQNNAED